MASRALPTVLGAIACTSGLATSGIDVVFAISLFSHTSATHASTVFIVATAVETAAVTLLGFNLQRHRSQLGGLHLRNVGRGKRYTYLLAGLTTAFVVLGAGASALGLSMTQTHLSKLPKKTYAVDTTTLLIIGFAIWAVALTSQALFLITALAMQRRAFQRQMQEYQSESLPQIQPRMVEMNRPRSQSAPECASPREASMEPESSPESGRRSRSASIRSYTSQIVRPMNSKTRLIPGNRHHFGHKRAPSLDSAHQQSPGPAEDGFDSWDTSNVDPPNRQAVEAVSPTPAHSMFLDTIPQSPTDRRSPSPAFALEFSTPKTRQRSRSFSPAPSRVRESARTTRAASPADSTRNSQANIHPLFRIDSPPPPCTPGTMVTAAPGAGLVIADRHSIRSIHRMRSGSLPASPLMHSTSTDNIRKGLGGVSPEDSDDDDAAIERRLTPPVPDWILGAGARQSEAFALRAVPKSPLPVGLGIGVVGEAL